MNFCRKAYSIVGALLLLEYVLQFLFIGAAIFGLVVANPANNAPSTYAAFHSGNSDLYYNLHVINGVFVIAITTLVLWAFSFGAKYPDRTIRLTGLLVLLLIVQDLLAGGLPFVPVFLFQFPALVAGLHPVTGTIMLTVATWLVYKHWAFGARGKKVMQLSPANPKP